MKNIVRFGIVAVVILTFFSCGGGGRDVVVVEILSSGGALDGDITFDSVAQTYSPFFSSDPPNTVQVGEDPSIVGLDSRGFITFPIDSIPPGAIIQAATILLPIFRVQVLSPPSVSVLVDMVSFPPLDTLLTQSALENVYHTEPILLGPSFGVFAGDEGTDKIFDATDALLEARRRGLGRLQIRLIGSFGQVIIDDLDPPEGLTPLLQVEYI